MTILINVFFTTSLINQNGERKKGIDYTEKPFVRNTNLE